ncbi:MAG: hypothetical protein ACYTKD_05510 [Planctomycetota bacterium]|jgi:hypothetical protein
MGDVSETAEVREILAGHGRARQELIPILHSVVLDADSRGACGGVLTF